MTKGLSKSHYNKLKPAQKKLFYWSKKYKRYYHKKYQSSYTKKNPNNQLVTKAQLDRALDREVEDKYIRDAVYIPVNNGWVQGTHSGLWDITPTITANLTQAGRVGIKISPKIFKMEVRYIPQHYTYFDYDTTGVPGPLGISPIPSPTPLKLRVIRINRKLYNEMFINNPGTAHTEIMTAIRDKYLEAGQFRQDVEVKVENNIVSSIQSIYETELPTKHRTFAVRTSDDVLTGAGQVSWVSTPITTYKRCWWKMPTKKMTIDPNNNQDIQYMYFLYYSLFDKRLDGNYNPLNNQPYSLAIRKLFIYEDA